MEKSLSGPGRKTKLSKPEAAAVFFLLLLTGGILCAALYMAARNRVILILLDPYAELVIEGADGYGRASAGFDKESFRADLEEKVLSVKSTLTEEEIHELAEMTAESAVFEYSSEKTNDDSDRSEKRSYVENISNGDTVTLNVTISDETQELWREKGVSLAFDCNPLVVTAGGLPEAEPYDPFEDLDVSFSGFEGNGSASVFYSGQYPISFSCEPGANLHNRDTVVVRGDFSSGYDMRSFISDYHIVPSSLEREYTVSGLLINPTSIDDFTVDILKEISENARTVAMILIQEEYRDGETIELLENAGMYYACSKDSGNERDSDSMGDSTEENAGGADEASAGDNGVSADGTTAGDNAGSEDEATAEENGVGADESAAGDNADGSDGGSAGDNGVSEDEATGEANGVGADETNFLVSAFRVNYSNEKGQKMKYYYYIRYDDLVLKEDGTLIADFTRVTHPEKSSTPIEMVFGEGDDVSLPGLLNFRTLEGFKTLDDLYEKALAPHQNEYEISSFIQP